MMVEDNEFIIEGPPPAKPLLDRTLGSEILENLLSNPGNHDAMVDAFTGEKISYRSILERSVRLATCLRSLNLDTNNISISSQNSLEFFIPVLASLFSGVTMVPLNHMYTIQELRHVIDITKPKIIFTSYTTVQKYLQIQREFHFVQTIVVIDSQSDISEALSLRNFEQACLGHFTMQPEHFKPFAGSVNQPAFILCSSGTTGLPKGVMLSHRNLMTRLMHTRDPRYTVLTADDGVLGVLPFFHGFGLITTLGALANGFKVVVLRRFDEDVFLQAIQNYRLSILWLAPPLLVFLAKSPKVFNYDLSSIKEVLSGAAPLSKQTEATVKKRLNIRSIKQGYGLTESTLAVIISGSDEARAGSSGRVISYMVCKVRDPETGKSLGPNQVGELCFKGPMVMLGYYENAEATRSTFTSDGWLRSGDLGYYDEDKYFYIVDRLKELIKYKGFQVAPAELEAIILNHPKVTDVGVVGVPDEDAGELPKAFVVRADASLSEKEVQDYVAGLVSSQKRLRGGVEFVASIPKNPSGKILRRELRKLKAKL